MYNYLMRPQNESYASMLQISAALSEPERRRLQEEAELQQALAASHQPQPRSAAAVAEAAQLAAVLEASRREAAIAQAAAAQREASPRHAVDAIKDQLKREAAEKLRLAVDARTRAAEMDAAYEVAYRHTPYRAAIYALPAAIKAAEEARRAAAKAEKEYKEAELLHLLPDLSKIVSSYI